MRFLIVVDMQNDFISGSLGSDMAKTIVPAVVRKVRGFGGMVIFTRDTHGEDYADTQEGRKLPVSHCVKDSEGESIDEIELCGLCTDICVISNAMILKSTFPEATVRVDSACCAGVTKESHETALAAMRAVQIEVL